MADHLLVDTLSDKEDKPQKGGAKKWWLIGCGGCLGLLLIVAAAVVALCGLGVNALKETSGKAASDIFGPHYQPTDYQVIAFPIGQFAPDTHMLNFAMLLPTHGKGTAVFAFDTQISNADVHAIKSRDPKRIATYLQTMSDKMIAASHRSSSSSRINGVQFGKTMLVTLENGKQFAINGAVAELERRGKVIYAPSVAALVPEAQNRLVTLFAVGNQENQPADMQTQNFKPEQAVLGEDLKTIIQDSALDERLIQ
jgi:hypothetical protein